MSEQKQISARNDEIDLIELIKTLWNKKIWIILSTFIFALLAGVYAFTAKEQWTSKARIIAPKLTEIGSFIQIKSEYAEFMGKEIDFGKERAHLFHSLRELLQSSNVKKDFLMQSGWAQSYLVEANDKQKEQYIAKFIDEYLLVSRPDTKNKTSLSEDNELRLSFSTETAQDAQDVLKSYVQYVNSIAIKQELKEFKTLLETLLVSLSLRKEQIDLSLNEAKTVQIHNLEKALEIAKKAGVKDFSRSISAETAAPEYLLGEGKLNISDSKLSDGTYLFMLGEKYLQAQLDTVKTLPVIHTTEYHKLDRQVTLLTELVKKVDNLNDVKAYYYLSEPDYPVKKDKPKRLLILIAGIVFGMFTGCVIVLARAIFNNRKA